MGTIGRQAAAKRRAAEKAKAKRAKTVAIVCNEADLDLLIGALASNATSERVHQFRDDLLRLRREAFGR